MNADRILDIFRETGALLEGHFILASGRHSARYFQCARVLQHPQHLIELSAIISGYFTGDEIDTVISPAIGGVVVGTEVGRQLGKKTIFAERKNGEMQIRRGFEVQPGEKFLVVEDVITTGGSVREVVELLEAAGAEIAGVGVIVDRSNGKVQLHPNQFAVLTVDSTSYASDEIPPELAAIPASKPGSRANQV